MSRYIFVILRFLFSCPLPGYVEDCVCNIGYVRDGDYCVRKSECGQIVDGKYISKSKYNVDALEKESQNESKLV